MINQRKSAEQLLGRIENAVDTNTDPNLINQILSELKLNNFKTADTNFNKFMQKLKVESIDTSLLINNIKQSLLDNEPLCSLLAYIQDNELVMDEEIQMATDIFKLQLNLLFFFEALTVAMTNSPVLIEDIYSYILQQRGSFSPGNPYINFFFGTPLDASFFKRLKMISIDPAMAEIVFNRTTSDRDGNIDDLNKFINKFGLSSWNADLLPAKFNTIPCNVSLNILEAAMEDATRHSNNDGRKDNAIAGFGLIGLLEDKQYNCHYTTSSTILPKNNKNQHGSSDLSKYELIPSLEISKLPVKRKEVMIEYQWKDLYISWNLFFVMSNLEPIYFPITLLIPSILSSKPNNFMEIRVMSLFLMGNLFLNLQLDKNAYFSNKFKFIKSNKIFSEWGRINKNYAEYLFKTILSVNSKSPSQLFDDTFGNHITTNFIKYLISFVTNQKEFYVTTYSEKAKKGNCFSFFTQKYEKREQVTNSENNYVLN